MSGHLNAVDERVELLAREWEAELGAPAALRLAIAQWLRASEAVSFGYLRLRQPATPTVYAVAGEGLAQEAVRESPAEAKRRAGVGARLTSLAAPALELSLEAGDVRLRAAAQSPQDG